MTAPADRVLTSAEFLRAVGRIEADYETRQGPPDTRGAVAPAAVAAAGPVSGGDSPEAVAPAVVNPFAELSPPYSTIVADPPWAYRSSGITTRTSHGTACAEDNYSTMTNGEIARLPVADLAADDAHCRSILDRLMPPDQCDLAHADRAMLHGRNMVPDERWNGMA